MDLKNRILEYIKFKGLSVKSFEEMCSLSNGAVSKMGDNTRRSTIDKISNTFPDLNSSWLLTGEGAMLRADEPNAALVGSAAPAIAEDTVPVRLFEVTPTATFQEFCAGASETPDTTFIIPRPGENLDDTFCVFEVFGESMAPQIQPHARVLCQEIPPTRWHYLTDCIIVIAYGDRFVIKRIIDNHLACANFITLASDNPDFPARETVPLADIRAIFRARRIISSDIL